MFQGIILSIALNLNFALEQFGQKFLYKIFNCFANSVPVISFLAVLLATVSKLIVVDGRAVQDLDIEVDEEGADYSSQEQVDRCADIVKAVDTGTD